MPSLPRISSNPQAAASILRGLLAFGYVDCASVTLLLYDYCLTLRSEIEYIWPCSRSPIGLLFFVIRYPAIIDSGILMIRAFSSSSVLRYETLYKAQVYLYVAGILLSNLLLLLRTSAIWNKNRKITVGLSLTLTIVAALSIYFVIQYLSGLVFQPSPFPSAPGCFVEDNHNNLYIPYASMVIFESVVLVLTVFKVSCTSAMGTFTG